MVHASPETRIPSGAKCIASDQVSSSSEIDQLRSEVLELKQELMRSERRVEAMKQIGRALGSSLELDLLLDELVRRTTDLLEADRSTLFLVDQKNDQLWSKVLEGQEHREIRLQLGAGIAGWVADSGEPLLIPDAYADDRFNRDFDIRSGYRTRDILTWPVKRPQHATTIGVIQVLNKRVGRFDRNDERLIEAIASEIGVALEVAALYREALERTEALERARGELALLFETERAISQSSNLAVMLGTILDTTMATMGAETGAMHVLDERGSCLETLVAQGVGAPSLLAEHLVPGEGLVGTVIKTNEPVCLRGESSLMRGQIKVRSIAAVPIRDREEVMGVLELMNPRERGKVFDQADVETLTLVAAQAGRAIVAERRRREREQQDRLSAIGQMLSGILHDFRTPMTLISGYTQIMADTEDAANRTQYAQLVDRQIDLLTSMTKDLLAFARGERSILLRKVQVRRFMDEMNEYLQTELDGSGVQAHVLVEYRGPARFDETKLRRVFHNIARNAREAMSEGGHFWVTVRAQDKELMFAFEDDGPGIPTEIKGRVFEPFATSGKVGGTGLGLTMVRQIAEEHGGQVVVASREGGGTRFEFRIPLGVELKNGRARGDATASS